MGRTDDVESTPVEERRDALAERLQAEESIRYVLEGRLLDYERDDPDREVREDSRTRKVASHGRSLLTAVTDRRLLFVVGRRDGVDDEQRSVPYEEVTAVDLEATAGNRRLVVRGATRYYVDVGRSDPAEAAAARAFVRDRIDERERESGSGCEEGSTADRTGPEEPLEALERLADLHERGALTETEFAEKKRELLDRL